MRPGGTAVFRRMVPVLAALLGAFAAGCATGYTASMKPVTDALRRDAPREALEDLRGALPDSTGRNRLLYLMEAGNLHRLAGDYDEARRLLLAADRLGDLQRGIEVGQEIEAFLTSDNALEFRGADYEKVLVNYCLAMCYALEGEMMDALVECRRVNDKLRALNVAYEDNPNRYSDDAFVRYLTGVLYEMSGDLDDALVAYRSSASVYDSSYAEDYGLPAPERVRADVLRLSSLLGMQGVYQSYRSAWPDVSFEGLGPTADSGEVVLVLEVGLVPPREERSETVVVDERVYRFSLPAIPDAPRRVREVRLSAGGASARGFLAEDVAAIARENLEDHAGRSVARAVARLALKAGVSEAGEELVEELTGEDSAASRLAGLFLSVVGAATERADLRAWLTLPSQIYVARLRLPPGERRVTVAADGWMLCDTTLTVDPGGMSLLFLSESGY